MSPMSTAKIKTILSKFAFKKIKKVSLSMKKLSIFPLSKLLLAFSRIRFPVLPLSPLFLNKKKKSLVKADNISIYIT